MKPKFIPLAVDEQERLRALITEHGSVDRAAERLEIPRDTYLRASAGCGLLACTRLALRAALARV